MFREKTTSDSTAGAESIPRCEGIALGTRVAFIREFSLRGFLVQSFYILCAGGPGHALEVLQYDYKNSWTATSAAPGAEGHLSARVEPLDGHLTGADL